MVEAVEPHLPAGVRFVPAHPVAGTEFSGPDAGFASLFTDTRGQVVLLGLGIAGYTYGPCSAPSSWAG